MAKDFLSLLQGYECVGSVDGAYMFNANGTLVMVNTNNNSKKSEELLSDFISEKSIELTRVSDGEEMDYDREMVIAD